MEEVTVLAGPGMWAQREGILAGPAVSGGADVGPQEAALEGGRAGHEGL